MALFGWWCFRKGQFDSRNDCDTTIGPFEEPKLGPKHSKRMQHVIDDADSVRSQTRAVTSMVVARLPILPAPEGEHLGQEGRLRVPQWVINLIRRMSARRIDAWPCQAHGLRANMMFGKSHRHQRLGEMRARRKAAAEEVAKKLAAEKRATEAAAKAAAEEAAAARSE